MKIRIKANRKLVKRAKPGQEECWPDLPGALTAVSARRGRRYAHFAHWPRRIFLESLLESCRSARFSHSRKFQGKLQVGVEETCHFPLIETDLGT